MNAYHAFRGLKRKRRGENRRFANASGSERPRKGFTLIELLVVMAIMATLAALMIAFLPNAASAQREARAATLLQSWLNIAKQRALRDQAPRGLRLWIVQNPTGYFVGGVNLSLTTPVVTDCQYIEQPPDFPGTPGTNGTGLNMLLSGPPPGAPNTYNNTNTVGFFVIVPGSTQQPQPLDLSNGFGVGAIPNSKDPNSAYWLVQPGDYLEILGSGLMHQIEQVGVPGTKGINSNYVLVTPALANPPMLPTTNWRILRAPRVVGDETLKLPDSTLIDLGTNTTYGNTPPPTNAFGLSDSVNTAGYIDILFAPNGSVMSPGVTTGTINLWVRSPDEHQPTNVFRGDPTIVSVFVKTGLVGAYPPDQNLTGGSPYTFVK